MLLQCRPENHSLYQMINSLNIPIKNKNILFTGSHDFIEKIFLIDLSQTW